MKIKYFIPFFISIPFGIMAFFMGLNFYNEELDFYLETGRFEPNYHNIVIGIGIFLIAQIIALSAYFLMKLEK